MQGFRNPLAFELAQQQVNKPQMRPQKGVPTQPQGFQKPQFRRAKGGPFQAPPRFGGGERRFR